MEQQIPIYFIIAKPRPKHNAAAQSADGCVPFIRSMSVALLPFQLRQLRFHLRDQHLQLLLTLLARMRIHISRVLFAVDPCRGVAAFKQVVVDLADAARAGLADFAHIRLKVDDGGRIRLRRRLVLNFSLADAAVDLPRGGVLHIRGRVRVNVQRRGCGHMAQHGGERFYVHPILQRQGRKCVSEVVKTHLFAVCVLQDQLQSVVDRGALYGRNPPHDYFRCPVVEIPRGRKGRTAAAVPLQCGICQGAGIREARRNQNPQTRRRH